MGNLITIEKLKATAVIYWPLELANKEQDSSVIPLLLQTQDNFISLLNIASKSPYAWIDALDLSEELYSNLFLKHLCVLSDIGGESLKRFANELPKEFKDKDFKFVYRNQEYVYKLASLFEKPKWSNPSLGLNGKGLVVRRPMTQNIKDVAILIMFGSLTTNSTLPKEIESKCIIGSMLGDSDKLEKFVKERYIWVSQITGGAKAQKLGELAEIYIKEKLKYYLPEWDLSAKTIEGISQNKGRTLTRFDIVAKSPKGICWGIEVSFQFTTNSTVERKAKLAQERLNLLHAAGHKVAYVVDGAGNFERASFLQDLIDFSDCIVNFSEGDIRQLADTIRLAG